MHEHLPLFSKLYNGWLAQKDVIPDASRVISQYCMLLLKKIQVRAANQQLQQQHGQKNNVIVWLYHTHGIATYFAYQS